MLVDDQILWDYIDGNLPDSRKSEIEKIFGIDHELRERYYELLHIHNIVQNSIIVEEVPIGLEAKILERLTTTTRHRPLVSHKSLLLFAVLPMVILSLSISLANGNLALVFPISQFFIKSEYILIFFFIILVFAYCLFLLQYILFKIKLDINNSNLKH